MRKILIGVGVLLVAAIVVLLVVPLPGIGEAQSTVDTTRTTQVERTTLYETVEGTGSIEAEQLFDLSFGSEGTVEAVYVAAGDEVVAGQMLAKLETSELEDDLELAELEMEAQQAEYDDLMGDPTEQEIAQARQQVISAQIQVDNAQADVESTEDELLNSCSGVETAQKNLEESQAAYDDYLLAGYEQDATFIPDPDTEEAQALENAQSSYDSADAQCNIAMRNSDSTASLESAQLNLEQAEADYEDLLDGPDIQEIANAETQLRQAQVQLSQAQEALENATITAPMDGLVTAVNIVQGETVEAVTVVVSIADMSRLHVDMSVDELDIVNIEAGQTASVTIEAFDDAVVPGSVQSVAPSGTSSQGLVTYIVRVELDSAEVAVEDADTAAQSVDAADATASQGSGFMQAQNAPQAAPDGAVPAAGMGGGLGGMQTVFTVVNDLGGADALSTLLAEDDGAAQFYAMLADAGVSEDVITRLQDGGGAQSLIDMLGQMPESGPGASADQAADTANTEAGAAPTNQTTDTAPAQESAQTSTSETLAIRLGMTTEVEIVINLQENVLVVPTSAVQTDGQGEYLMADDGSGNAVRVSVTTGDTDSGMTVVSGDIAEGDTVYVPVTTVSSPSSSTTGSSAAGMGGLGSLLGGGGGMPAGGGPGGPQ